MNSDPQPVFRALADPTRRAIVELLAGEAMPIGAIVDRFDVSRPAIAKHLKILEEGGLIRTAKKGRERINVFDPDGLSAARGWIAFFDQFWDEKLATLKDAVEADSAE